MKPSNLQTPRTLAETTFTTGYSSYQPKKYDPADHIIFWGCTIAATVTVLIMVFVPGAW